VLEQPERILRRLLHHLVDLHALNSGNLARANDNVGGFVIDAFFGPQGRRVSLKQEVRERESSDKRLRLGGAQDRGWDGEVVTTRRVENLG